MRPDIILDANLLTLLLVGMVDRSQVGTHARVRNYKPEDYDALENYLKVIAERGASIIVSPNVWTEVSNLLFQKEGKRDFWSKIAPVFRKLVELFEERSVPTRAAVLRDEFRYLGVSDAVLLELAATTGAAVLTNDGLLGREASRPPAQALNFEQIKVAWAGNR